MRVRYSFSSRRTRKLDKISKQKTKYPKLLLQVIETSDIILEVLDARFAKEMQNKEIETLIEKKDKKLILVLNKADLSSKKMPKHSATKGTLSSAKQGISVSCKTKKGVTELRNKIKILANQIKKSETNKFHRIQVGVIGYPNSGKSSLINVLIGKNSAKIGAEAGFTKGIQKLRLTSEIMLLDSPGVIPNDQYSSSDATKISKHTKVGGRSASQVKDPENIVAEIMKEHSKQIEKYYKINAKADTEILIEKLGKKKGFLKKGGKVNEDQTSRLILKDFQDGKIKL
jgi:ribosome biogenesis GTPase A